MTTKTATAYGKVQPGKGEFTIPELDDGYYPAKVKQIKDSQGQWEGTDYDQYIIEYELDDLVDSETNLPVTMAQFVRIPDGVVNDGVLNENSKLYECMEAFGCDMEEPEIDPGQWIGKPVRIHVENKKVQSGKNAGQVRPRITAVKAPANNRAAKPAAAKAKAKAAPKDDEQDEDF